MTQRGCPTWAKCWVSRQTASKFSIALPPGIEASPLVKVLGKLMDIKISDLVAEFLEARGLKHVFGIIGAGNANLFDAVGRHGKTEIVCVHHEQAACMSAQIYYRVTGQISATLLTTGAGSTNAVTGIVSAWMDSIPLLAISGNENSKWAKGHTPLRAWGVQGYDSTEMVRQVTKYAVRVFDPAMAVYELEKACAIALSGRPGPVWVDIPMDIQAMSVKREDVRHYEIKDERVVAAPDLVAAFVKKIRAAHRPVLWLGNGIRLANAAQMVKPAVERLGIPTLVSWAGIDMIDSDHPLVYGRAGVYGQRCANFVLQNADLVATIGTRMAIPQIGYVHDELAREAEFLVVDVDRDEAMKLGERVSLPIVADAGLFMTELLNQLAGENLKAPPAWISQCETYRKRYPWVGAEHADQPPYINSYPFMEKLVGHFKPDQVVVTDMGTALLSGHQVLKTKDGQRLMTSTGLGEMGYGLPGAIGASFARDRGEVMCLNCDGGMMMNLQELQTMAHHRLPIKLFIFNNDGYLMIKHTQTNLYAGRGFGVDNASGVSCPDFSKLAKAFDFPAYQIHTWEDFDRVIPLVQAEKGPVICEVFMHPMQYFVPKLSLAVNADGAIVSPPLEDLSPLLLRDELRQDMIVGMHPKSESL
jgi:acetolactate synthase-1/2/3 large subunit